MMNAAVIIVVSTTLLIHCGHCQQKVTFLALQDTPKTLHSLNVRSNNNPGLQCTQSELRNFLAEECDISVPESPFDFELDLPLDVCQQQCREMLLAYFNQCNLRADAEGVVQQCW